MAVVDAVARAVAQAVGKPANEKNVRVVLSMHTEMVC